MHRSIPSHPEDRRP